VSSRRPKIALVASIGGHIAELLALREAYSEFDHFYVFNEPTHGPAFEGAPAYAVTHSERDLRVLTNAVEFWRIFRRERPTAMLSTGAGQAVGAAVAAKVLGMRVVFVDSVAAVDGLSLTGSLMLALTDAFFVQWPHLAHPGDGIYYRGSIFGESGASTALAGVWTEERTQDVATS
jgi:beta-1,4-N-acetylglucosaminyltransferase